MSPEEGLGESSNVVIDGEEMTERVDEVQLLFSLELCPYFHRVGRERWWHR